MKTKYFGLICGIFMLLVLGACSMDETNIVPSDENQSESTNRVVELTDDDFYLYKNGRILIKTENTQQMENAIVGINYLYTGDEYYYTFRNIAIGSTKEDVLSAYNGLVYTVWEYTYYSFSEEYIFYEAEQGELAFIFKTTESSLYKPGDVTAITIKSSALKDMEKEIINLDGRIKNVTTTIGNKIYIDISQDEVSESDLPSVALEIFQKVNPIVEKDNLIYSLVIGLRSTTNNHLLCQSEWSSGEDKSKYTVDYYDSNGKSSKYYDFTNGNEISKEQVESDDTTKENKSKDTTVDDIINARKWYQGGTLSKGTIADWNKATYENKLATCADIIASANKTGLLNIAITDVNSIKPYAEQLVLTINESVKGLDAMETQKVSDVAVLAMYLLNWVDS